MFLTAAAALVVGGALLLANQVTPISGWTCVALGLALLAAGLLLGNPTVTGQLDQATDRAMTLVQKQVRRLTVSPALPTSAQLPPSRMSSRCLGSTDGHHRWSRDPNVCMLCGKPIGEDRR